MEGEESIEPEVILEGNVTQSQQSAFNKFEMPDDFNVTTIPNLGGGGGVPQTQSAGAYAPP